MNIAKKVIMRSRLLDLIEGLTDIFDSGLPAWQLEITGMQIDNRFLQPGDLFIACFGKNHDARNYIDQAILDGSSAVLVESGCKWKGTEFRSGVPVIAIDNLPAKISEISSRFYGKPSEKSNVIGITGTNGKTSCSQFIAQSLLGLGHKCGVLGTLGYGLPGDLRETSLTTPDALVTQRLLSEMVENKVCNIAMEVSSIGLHQHRVSAVKFDTAIFTNLSRDHLDYHKDMEDYAKNKRQLFRMPDLKSAIVNLDDIHAVSVINSIASDVDVLTYSMSNKNASVYAEVTNFTKVGYGAEISTPLGKGKISGKLIGDFNLSNALAVTAYLSYFSTKTDGIGIQEICEQISALQCLDGRMEIVGDNNEVKVIVDYAHTPDALKSALNALSSHFDGKIWCIFGCGGNRDKGKRSIMGEVAEHYADYLVVTDDNPRNESGDEIIQHILSGMSDPHLVSIIRDRAKAIAFAIKNASEHDVVLIAGKGHETCQDVLGAINSFSDSMEARRALQERGLKVDR